MRERWGLGPVFVYESLLNARRWQVYAGRSLFVLCLLIGMTLVWVSEDRGAAPVRTFQQMALIGQGFFYALTGIEITLVMLAAPAAAAGSICMDRARGTLLHMMVTDLSDSEIVLGKLGSRLAPVFGLIACGVPVTALAALLGGIDFDALFGALVVSVALTLLGCALAMAISVRAKKSHEVLMAVYMIECLGLVLLPIWWNMNQYGGWMAPPDWFQKLNPFVLTFGPYSKPGFVGPLDYVIFFAGALATSAGLTALSILTLRREVVAQAGRPEKVLKRGSAVGRRLPSLPGPTLDANPVLWREWHRSRPSRLARLIWAILFISTWGLAAWGTVDIIRNGVEDRPNPLPFGFVFQIFFGLLMVSAIAPTALAEERVRSSLDVLLATPMSTRSIVVGKWWGTYRWVLVLALMPLYCASFLAVTTPDLPSYTKTVRFTYEAVPLSLTDRIVSGLLCPADFLASGAMIVSLGVALSTWVRRLGRAVATSVIAFLAIGLGWMFLVQSLWYRFFPMQPYPTNEHNRWLMCAVCAISPLYGPVEVIQEQMQLSFLPRTLLWIALGTTVLVKLAIAAFLFWMTVKTFDRCMGRVPESGVTKLGRQPGVVEELMAVGT